MKSVYTGGEKVAEFESYDELRVGENKPAFIYEGSELVYPNPVKSGLVLWYDFSGMTNSDTNRGIATDLSGNGNHGTLQNFNYTAESGYDKNKLLFDGVDDFIQVPEMGLNPESMSIGINRAVYSYDNNRVSGIDENGNLFNSGQNIALNTNETIYGDSYQVGEWWLSENIEVGVTYTFVAQGLPQESGSFRAYLNGASTSIGFFSEVPDSDLYILTFKVTDTVQQRIRIYHYNNVVGAEPYAVNKVALYKGELQEVPKWSPSPHDFITDRINEGFSPLHNLLLYNRPLTPEEIQHNYQIEKERFGIE